MGGKLTAMTTYIATFVILSLLAGIWVLLERNHRRTAGMPHASVGGKTELDSDLSRVLHDVGAGRRA